MLKIYTETLIIGGGPAGMASAMELSKKKKDFILVEKDGQVGGLSKTYTFKEDDGSVFHTDNGPHRFFSKNPYLYEFIGELLREDWIEVERSTKQYIDGKYYDYPINAVQALRNIGFRKAVRMVFDYVLAKIAYSVFRKPIRSFEDYVVANFGRSLGEFNMINYTEKIWGIPAGDIHTDWGEQRIKGLDLFQVAVDSLRGMFRRRKNTAKSLIDSFYYPRKGTGEIYEAIKTKIEKQGYKLMTGMELVGLDIEPNGFVSHFKSGDGALTEISSKYVIESVPVGYFIRLIRGSSDKSHVLQAVSRLRYRSQVYLFITLNKRSISRDQWIYFPSKSVAMGRISEMKNFSPYMSPPDKTSLFVEFFCFEGDEIWDMDKEGLLKMIMPDCKQAGLFDEKEIRQVYKMRSKDSYPIYDVNYKEPLGEIKRYLDAIPNLFYVGRPGRFRYNNQDHSLEMGILAAKSVIDGQAYDIESVGTEKSYFEGGSIPVKKNQS